METKEQFRVFVEDHSEWTFAKTMPQNPHFYTLRENAVQSDFNQAVQFIRDHGYKQKYGKHWYTCLNVNQWKYWSMGWPVDQTTLINRTKVNAKNQYDAIASGYDLMFVQKKYLDEEKALFSIMGEIEGTVLDVGCGTGLFLNHNHISAERYLGIDPSEKMLEILLEDYPMFQVIPTTLEDYVGPKFDNVLAIFSASYVFNHQLFFDNWTKKGILFLVYFKPGYDPVAHKDMQNEMQFITYNEAMLEMIYGVKPIDFGNYWIIKKQGE